MNLTRVRVREIGAKRKRKTCTAAYEIIGSKNKRVTFQVSHYLQISNLIEKYH